MKDIPTIEPKEIITTITNLKTGEVYKDDADWKAKLWQFQDQIWKDNFETWVAL